jgi:hydroxymethylpyrimidine/phosphomethylpyrimidine kinase
MSVITAITAQNTLGVQGIYPLSLEAVVQQIDSIGSDLGADAVKTGMLFSGEIIRAVAGKVKQYGWINLVIDPVMVAKGGASLLQQEAVEAMRNELIPLARVVTPNIPEAEVLAGIRIANTDDRKKAAEIICGMGASHVVIKGGHDADEMRSTDLYYDGRVFLEFTGTRVETKHTHGTGCTFSAAIAAEIARGSDVPEAIRLAKRFIQAAIEDSLEIGGGHGPTNHGAYRARREGRDRAARIHEGGDTDVQ